MSTIPFISVKTHGWNSSWITYFFKSHYHIEEGKLGSIFFVTSIIAAASMIVASSLAKRFGNVRVSSVCYSMSVLFPDLEIF
jgi:MFS-type transporter involved in bile tolerance (Atg22 family)